MASYTSYIKEINLGGEVYGLQDYDARAMISEIAAGGLTYQIYESLPTAGADYKNIIALIPASGTAGTYLEYLCIQSGSTYSWEQIGTTATDIDPSSWKVTVPDAAAHSHALPNLVGASYTPSGTFTLTNTKTALTNIAQTKTAVDLTQAKTAADVTGASYTPAGSVTVTLASSAVTNIAQAKTAADVTNTKTAADVTGASYTPAGSVTVDSHTHANTLTSAASGGLTYAYGAATANRVTSVTSTTFTSVATNVSWANQTLYIDPVEVKGVNTVGTGTTVTGLSTSSMVLTNAAAQPGASFSGTAATITPGVSYSKVTGVSYSKFTAASYSYASGGSFSGTAATITPAVSYSKVTSASYSKFTAASYSKATPGTFSGSAATITPSYSSAFGTATTQTAVGGGAAGEYSVHS